MDQKLQDRLNQILDLVTSKQFLHSTALGGELGFWIFDYAPKNELQVREYISHLENSLDKKYSGINYVHLNLFSTMVQYLESRGLLDKAETLQKTKGDESLRKALKGPLHMDKFVPFLLGTFQPEESDLVLISGVGSALPLIRIHNLLNAIHPSLGSIPVVIFYPGEYTGQAMSSLENTPTDKYYRAFKLIP